MIDITVYDTATGKIKRSLTIMDGQEEMLANVVDGESAVLGHFAVTQFYIKDGEARPYPVKTADYLTFSLASETWVDLRDAAEIAGALVQHKAHAQSTVLAVIKSIRASMITDLPGQEMIYLRKEAEARAYIADPAPDMANYPLMVREIGITAPTAADLAQIWLSMANQLMSVAGMLEAVRLGAPTLLDAASTEAEVDAVLGGLLAQMGV